MMSPKYPDYKSYLKHQIEAKWPGKKETYFKEHHEEHLIEFRLWFAKVKQFLDLNGTKSICLGPSFCAEVVAIRELGSTCIGLDLVALPPWSVEGDFHDVPFNDYEFDFVYSNALDHVYDMDKFLSEIKRILKPGGMVMMHLHLGQGLGGFESMSVKNCEEILYRMPEFDVLLNEKIYPEPARNKGMNWTLLLRDKWS